MNRSGALTSDLFSVTPLIQRLIRPKSCNYPVYYLTKEFVMNHLCRLFCLVFALLFVFGCGSGSPAPKAKSIPEGRSETKVVEGASAAGYNGSQMRKKIDKVLDQNDARNKEIEKGAGAAPSK
jgi:hypothetical protein